MKRAKLLLLCLTLLSLPTFGRLGSDCPAIFFEAITEAAIVQQSAGVTLYARLTNDDCPKTVTLLWVRNDSCFNYADEHETIELGANQQITVSHFFAASSDSCACIFEYGVGGKYGDDFDFGFASVFQIVEGNGCQ